MTAPDRWVRDLLDWTDQLLQVSGMTFSPEGEKVAISYCSQNFLEAVTWTLPTTGYIFSLADPTRPLARLTSDSAITTVQYSRQLQDTLLAGGCYSGQEMEIIIIMIIMIIIMIILMIMIMIIIIIIIIIIITMTCPGVLVGREVW